VRYVNSEILAGVSGERIHEKAAKNNVTQVLNGMMSLISVTSQ